MAIQLFTATETAEILGVSRSTAYRIIKKLNDELEQRGYITIPGKISKRYLSEKIYGGNKEIHQNKSTLDKRRAA